MRKELESFGAKLRVVKEAVRDGSRTKNYHIKAVSVSVELLKLLKPR